MHDTRILAMTHLRLRLRPLNRLLRQAVLRQEQGAVAQHADARPTEFKGLCISEQQVRNCLAASDALLAQDSDHLLLPVLDDQEQLQEQALRSQMAEQGQDLPLDALVRQLSLTPIELQLLLLCVAVELDRAYQEIYAYLLDDVRRREPCVELMLMLFAEGLTARSRLRVQLGEDGRLQRRGLLSAGVASGIGLQQTLNVPARLLQGLCGTRVDWAAEFTDHAEMSLDQEIHLPPQLVATEVKRLAQALAAHHLSLLGVWGEREAGLQAVVTALATWSGKALRRWPFVGDEPGHALQGLDAALRTARALDAVLWIDLEHWEPQGEASARRHLAAQLADHLAHHRQTLILSGHQPWRPTPLLAQGGYAEINVPPPDHGARQQLWRRHLPDLSDTQIAGLASRYHMNEIEMRAVAQVLAALPDAAPIAEAQVQAACTTVARRGVGRYAQVRVPHRKPEDLILPQQLHRQVMDVARFFRACARVDEDWGFGRMDSGGGGIKALFTGDSGTGKTLAAEVIAGRLGLTLMKVDLARIASKWIGETEKNLEAVFTEAEDSHALLFFDEADALFARRGAVERSADRYANLETGYLLQRLEDYRGLAVLASNLRDQIDSAFTRRFQFVIHFPRPGQEERQRLWHLAFPTTAPLDAGIDFTPFTQLDMTGAAIVSAGRTAALLAVDAGDAKIRSEHLVEAIARQYQMDARVLAPADLGPYAPLMQQLA